MHLMSASKKGMSAHQMHRMLGLTYKTRVVYVPSHPREPCATAKLLGPLGGQNKVVEADETFIGGKEANKHKAQAPARSARR